MKNLDPIVRAISELPGEWHTSGSVPKEVLWAIARLASGRTIKQSIETGSGKTTLLFSHVSMNHTVFAKDGGNNSIGAVSGSPILKPGVVTYVEGPTQQTLPTHLFPAKLQLALLDGPHAYPFPELEYYYIYPQLEEGALFILDDINIPTVNRMFSFLREDVMFQLLEVVCNTAFFRRTNAAVFDPLGDGWRMQEFNRQRFPIESLPGKARRLARAIKRKTERAQRYFGGDR